MWPLGLQELAAKFLLNHTINRFEKRMHCTMRWSSMLSASEKSKRLTTSGTSLSEVTMVLILPLSAWFRGGKCQYGNQPLYIHS